MEKGLSGVEVRIRVWVRIGNSLINIYFKFYNIIKSISLVSIMENRLNL